jgi:hypothetical protein
MEHSFLEADSGFANKYVAGILFVDYNAHKCMWIQFTV